MIASTLLGTTISIVENEKTTEENQKILTMRTLEGYKGALSSITIIYEDDKTETIELKNISKESISSNLVVINKTLNSIAKKGYELISVSGGGDTYILVTTYTFVKK